MKKLLKLFLVFAKIGAVTFGGGYAMLPILQREISEKYNWATEEELLDYFAIGQCTPGVIAVNTATFVGYKQCGILGGIVATLGVVFPSIVIITILAAFISNFAEYEAVKYAMSGIRACVCALVASAVVKIWKSAVIDKITLAIFIVCFLTAVFFKAIPTAAIVVIAGAAGLAVCVIKEKKNHKEADEK